MTFCQAKYARLRNQRKSTIGSNCIGIKYGTKHGIKLPQVDYKTPELHEASDPVATSPNSSVSQQHMLRLRAFYIWATEGAEYCGARFRVTMPKAPGCRVES